jgi:hypothetical protein
MGMLLRDGCRMANFHVCSRCGAVPLVTSERNWMAEVSITVASA